MLRNQIERLKEERLATLLIEKKCPVFLNISDRDYVFDKGSIVNKGSVEDLRENEEIIREYLGV
jgi:branched-chain amino acid transport system ATP-binding protein